MLHVAMQPTGPLMCQPSSRRIPADVARCTLLACLHCLQDDFKRAFQLFDVHGTGKIDAFTLRRVTKWVHTR